MKNTSTQIRFEGEGHQIDANTLVNTLIHYSALVNEINKNLSEGDREIRIRINAIEKGSFVVDIELIETVLQNLFCKDSIEYMAYLVAVIGGSLEAYKFFKGAPAPKNADIELDKSKTIIDKQTIINIYNQPSVRMPISKLIETAEQDKSVEGVVFEDKVGDVIKIERDEFNDLVYTDFDKENEIPKEDRVIIEDAILNIIKLSFEKGSRWEFIYDGFKISMAVKDSNLMSLIDKGMRFAKGDALRVKLEILRVYDYEYNVYVNKNYKILEFKEHILAPNQGSLPL